MRQTVEFRGKTARRALARSLSKGLCLAAAVLALIALGAELAKGIAAVAREEMTMAQMLSALGAWLRGG